MNRCGVYHRTAARLEDGTALAPVPILRWRCKVHGTVPWTPGFLRYWGHYLAYVVELALDEFTDPESPPPIDLISTVTGPAGITLRRWVQHLVCLDPQHLHRRLHQELLPPLERPGRTWRWSWNSLKLLAQRTRPAYGIFASCFLQWLRLHPPAPA